MQGTGPLYSYLRSSFVVDSYNLSHNPRLHPCNFAEEPRSGVSKDESSAVWGVSSFETAFQASSG
jgi:hypothetical protein